MYKKYNNMKQVIVIIYNLCKKEYGSKILIWSLIDYINKEHKHNISIKQQTWFSFIQKSYDKVNTIKVKDCLDVTINFVVKF